MEIEKLIDRYFLALERKVIREIYDKQTREELEKFIKSISKVGFDKILITHHHPDHYEFSRDIALKYKVPMEMSEFTYTIIGKEYFKDMRILKYNEILHYSSDINNSFISLFNPVSSIPRLFMYSFASVSSNSANSDSIFAQIAIPFFG